MRPNLSQPTHRFDHYLIPEDELLNLVKVDSGIILCNIIILVVLLFIMNQ